MSYVLVGFSTEKTDWFSRAIRFFTRCKYSHVVMVSPSQEDVIESTTTFGVRDVPFIIWAGGESVTEVRKIPHPCPEKAWLRAWAERGKPYDMKFSYGWFFRRNWQDPSAWACSELIAWAGEFFPADALDTITPRDLYLISEPLDA